MKKFIIILIITTTISARYHKITSTHELQHLMNRYVYSVVCFDQVNNKELEGVLQATASKYDFKRFLRKDLGFMFVNVGAKRTQDLISQYHITNQPVCYVFNYGAQDQDSKFLNPTSVKDLIDVLENSAGDDLAQLLQERKEEQSEEHQERVAAYYAYGGYYPYSWGNGWGGSSYWARPYWGWGNWLVT